jgi:hypothetical protein
MIEKIKESIYDWYVLNIREFYNSYIKNIGTRIRQATDMPLWVYKEQGFKETFLDLWQLPELESDEKYMASLRRWCNRTAKRSGIESKLSAY